MTRALIAAILTVYQVLAWTCPVLCQGALQHEAAVATEQRSVAAGEHHSHGHGADALAGVPSLSAVHDGCDNCAAPPTSMWSVTPKFATATPSTIIALVAVEPDRAAVVSHAAADQPLRRLCPDTSPPGLTLSPLRV